jgi:hypothetical protein
VLAACEWKFCLGVWAKYYPMLDCFLAYLMQTTQPVGQRVVTSNLELAPVWVIPGPFNYSISMGLVTLARPEHRTERPHCSLLVLEGGALLARIAMFLGCNIGRTPYTGVQSQSIAVGGLSVQGWEAQDCPHPYFPKMILRLSQSYCLFHSCLATGLPGSLSTSNPEPRAQHRRS